MGGEEGQGRGGEEGGGKGEGKERGRERGKGRKEGALNPPPKSLATVLNLLCETLLIFGCTKHKIDC